MMLHDIEFKELKIKGNLFAAPLAGYTNYPTRLILQEFGADLTFTEMISADGLVYKDDKTIHLMDTDEKEKAKVVQIFGNEQGILKESIEYIRDHTDYRVVNLNMGCPVKKILKAKKGGYLLKEEASLKKILAHLKGIKGICVTIKIRAGWDLEHLNYLKVGHWAEENNIKMLIFHPRTVVQGFKDKAHWEWTRELKEKISIPVIGNGDIQGPEDAKQKLEKYGVDGLMIGRGFLGNPWIFRNIKRFLRKNEYEIVDIKTRVEVMLYHLKAMIDYFGEKKGVINFRKQMFYYIKNFKNSARLRTRLQLLESFLDIKKLCHEFIRTE